ncbi:hypothetical protein ACJRO7_011911 [Eucalyptus globulus]|uniref:RRM domain-containing protein n=1 Tax=Eucalyptus globulus TaxID=34317 RepID=A0ABD3LGV3_EUCGL
MLTVARNPNLPPFSSCNCASSSTSPSLVLSTFRTHVSYRRSNPSPFASLFAGPSHRPFLSSSLRLRPPAHFDVHVVSGRKYGRLIKVGASRRRRRGGSSEADGLERGGRVMGYGSDDDDEAEEEEDEYEDEEDEDEEMNSPFEKMTRWHENRPPGFGVGKVYDTSVEDKLLEEMLHSRVAQAANINKLKHNPITPIPPKKDQPHLKVTEALPSGIPVRLVNLPKKKNIHRDLRLAFKGVDGITVIHPAVSGNKKTRDPICTGSAIVYFKSEEHAMSFIRTFSRQSLTFGKVQRQIKCEIMSSRLPIHANTKLASNTLVTSQISMPDVEGEPDLHPEPTSGSLEDLTSEKENDWNDEIELDEHETGEDMETFDVSDLETFNTLESGTKIVTASSSTEEQEEATLTRVAGKQKKPQPNPKKSPGKGKTEKVLKPEVPGYARRLKIQEKAVLTGVLSKYGRKAALTSNDKSLG